MIVTSLVLLHLIIFGGALVGASMIFLRTCLLGRDIVQAAGETGDCAQSLSLPCEPRFSLSRHGP